MKNSILCLICILLILSGCQKNHTTKSVVSENQNGGISDVNKKDLQESATIDKVEPDSERDEMVSKLEGKVIVVDAGHGINSYNKQEAIAPGSSQTKSAFASGTAGANQTEEQLNLSVALKLKEELEKYGVQVYMTRTEHKCDMTNIERAVFANELDADISVKIHADGSNNKEVHGVSVLVPGEQYISDSKVIEKSRKAGTFILEEFVNETEAVNRGISVRNDLTGFNWSEVPIVLVEMGFMTNPREDALMESEDYQKKIVTGIVNGLVRYFTENI